MEVFPLIFLKSVPFGTHTNSEEYAYLSARAHVKGIEDGILGEELFSKEQRGD